MQNEFPSNSRSKPAPEKPEPKQIKKVVTGDVVRRKKPLGKRFSEMFMGGDAKGVAGYVAFDVLLPAAKDMVADAVSQGVERMIFGEARSSGRRTGSRPHTTNGYVNYSRFAQGGSPARREDPRPSISHRARASHDFDEIIIPTRVEAEEVLDQLFALLERYGSAAVADLYEMVGVSGAYTDDKYGWVDLRGSRVERVRNGYLLDLPKPEPLD